MLAGVLMALLAGGCSPKKNTAATRNYQAFITRYNVHYNGDLHYRETLESMEKGYADDFSRLLPMHPAEARGDNKAPQPQGDFTRSIEKAQKAIQTRSIKKRPARQPGRRNDAEYQQWLKREEYNPFLHNSWMMMARSQYMNGEFLPAASTFLYIANHFKWLPQTVTEARLWQARSYCAAGWVNEAEATLSRVKQKDLTNGDLQGLYAYVSAEIAIRRGNYEAAIAPLTEAISHSKGAQKTRLNYLLGQICLRAGETDKAREAFRKVEGSASAPYSTRFNARISLSSTLSGRSENEIDNELKALKRMRRYDRNADYLDQIYYAEGNLLLAKGDTAAAMHSYAEAADKSKRTGMDMALARLALGNLYFDAGRYDEAQPCYAQAVPLLPDDFKGIDSLKLRSDILDELAVYSRTINLQDSLLKLADMPEAERIAVVDAIIERLRKAEEEERKENERQALEAKAAEMGADNNASSNNNAVAPTQFSMNTDKSWYFYNPTTRNAGSAEFRRRWGNRKQEDDWRRKNKNSYAPIEDESSPSISDTESPDDIAQTNGSNQDGTTIPSTASDPHTREFYLKDIPLTDEAKATAHAAIQDALYNSGLLLKDRLGDYAAARRMWNRLLTDYPDNTYRLDVYHNLYLMAAREGNMPLAEEYRKLIVSDFAESPEGVAMADPNYLNNLKEMHSRQELLYERTWQAYLDSDNDSVRAATTYAVKHFPMSRILPKFLFLDALTYATAGDQENFTSRLKKIIEQYPDADVSPLAASWIKGAAEGRGIVAGESNSRGMIWTTRLTSDSSTTDGVTTATDTVQVTLAPEAPRVVILAFPLDSVSANELLYEVARFNFTTFSVADFDLENLTFGPLGLIVISPFDNLAEARRYLARLDAPENNFLPPEVVTNVMPESDFRQLIMRGLTFDDYFRALEKAEGKEVHESVLPPEEYPSADEMYQTTQPDEENDDNDSGDTLG